MKRLVCEMCGGTDLIKQDGVFVCQSCGCKYSVEEAKKMMVEGTVEVTGTVKVDNSESIDNYLQMARTALTASNNKEAEDYANKIIEIIPSHSEAWNIKGEAAGWQSTGANTRLKDAVTAWINAIRYSDMEACASLRDSIAGKYVKLLFALLSMRGGNFGKLPSENNLQAFLTDLNSGVELMNRLTIEGGVSFNIGEIFSLISRCINNSACDGYKVAKSQYGPEHSKMGEWQWQNFYGNGDRCISLLQEALKYCRNRKAAIDIIDNLITMEEEVKESTAWQFSAYSLNYDNYSLKSSFNEQAKKVRKEMIDGWKSERSLYEGNVILFILERIQSARSEAEIAYAKKKYWEEHLDEKEALESEKSLLNKEVMNLNEEISSLSVSMNLAKTKRSLNDLQAQKNSLGIFKGKEKKALQAQIDELENTRVSLETEEATAKKPLMDMISARETRITEIENEFKKNRGTLSPFEEFVGYSSAVNQDGFTITPEALAEDLSQNLPAQYEVNGVVDPQDLGLPGFGSQWYIQIFLSGKKENEKFTLVNVYCKAQTKTDVVESIIVSIPSGAKRKAGFQVPMNFAIIGSYVLKRLIPDTSCSDAEKILLEMIYGEECTPQVIGNIRLEYMHTEQSSTGGGKIGKESVLIRVDNLTNNHNSKERIAVQ